MNRTQLEHIIRAAGDIANVKEIIVLGSQAILGQFPKLSQPLLHIKEVEISVRQQSQQTLCMSCEADVMILGDEEKAELIEAVIGELSPFHETFGYYAQTVDETTAMLPNGWQERLIPICNENTNGITGYCLEIHDLIISKLNAGREKDFYFFKAAINLHILSEEILINRLNNTPLPANSKTRLKHIIERFLQ